PPARGAFAQFDVDDRPDIMVFVDGCIDFAGRVGALPAEVVGVGAAVGIRRIGNPCSDAARGGRLRTFSAVVREIGHGAQCRLRRAGPHGVVVFRPAAAVGTVDGGHDDVVVGENFAAGRSDGGVG